MPTTTAPGCRRFFVFAKAVVAKLEAQGFWADYIDPCSGLPVRSASRPKPLSCSGALWAVLWNLLSVRCLSADGP